MAGWMTPWEEGLWNEKNSVVKGALTWALQNEVLLSIRVARRFSRAWEISCCSHAIGRGRVP